jgi:hypothetical protein
MKKIISGDVAGNQLTTVYNSTAAEIGQGIPVQVDFSSTNVLGVKPCAAPGALADFIGVTQNSIAVGKVSDQVVCAGYTSAVVLATATTTVGSFLYPVTVSGNTYLKESKTRTNITLRENITASSGSRLLANVFIAGGETDRQTERLRHDVWPNPAVATVAAVHAANASSGSVVTTVTTGFTNPDFPRNLSVTPAGTTADVAAMSVTVTGTDVYGAALSEDFAFSANAATATVGSKAFKTVTGMSIPVQDGNGATFSVDTGSKLGLYDPIQHTTLCKAAFRDGTLEGTLPTLTGSTAGAASLVATSTALLNSALNSTQVDVYYVA